MCLHTAFSTLGIKIKPKTFEISFACILSTLKSKMKIGQIIIIVGVLIFFALKRQPIDDVMYFQNWGEGKIK